MRLYISRLNLCAHTIIFNYLYVIFKVTPEIFDNKYFFQSQFGYSFGCGVPQGIASSPKETFMFGNPKPAGGDFYQLIGKQSQQASFGGT